MAVSPQVEKFNRGIIKKHHLTFDILSDPGNALAKKFAITYDLPDDLRKVYQSFNIDLERFNADGLWRLCMPSRYVIDQDSVIRAHEVNADHTVRPEPSETVDFLRKMMQKS